jgi:DNA-binding Lrp family transcriptional regulator
MLIIDLLQGGWPMTQAAITEAVGRRPAVVREELYRLVISGRVSRICGTGSMPALYALPTPANNYNTSTPYEALQH